MADTTSVTVTEVRNTMTMILGNTGHACTLRQNGQVKKNKTSQ